MTVRGFNLLETFWTMRAISLTLIVIFDMGINVIVIIIIYNNNHGSTALYELRPPLSEVTGSCAFVAVGDWPTGRTAVLSILM
jgi:hypothetical protein